MFVSDKKEAVNVAVYVRVSTHGQDAEGFSKDEQVDTAMRFLDYSPQVPCIQSQVKVFEDVSSGASIANRQSLQRLLALIEQQKVDVIVIKRIDRLSRDLKHLLTIFKKVEKKGIRLISIDENMDFTGAIGNLVFNIFGAIAEFEHKLIRARTYDGKYASARSGNFIDGRPPYGYEKVVEGKTKRLKVIPAEKKIVQRIYHMYVDENMSDETIATQLEQEKVPRGHHAPGKPRSGKWTKDVVAKIITNPINKGTYVPIHKGIDGKPLPEDKVIITKVPACISQFYFEIAQQERASRGGGSKSDRVYILQGLMVDMSIPESGSLRHFSGVKRDKDGKHNYRRKQFTKHGESYPIFTVPAEQLEQAVWGRIKRALCPPEQFIRDYLGTANERQERTTLIENDIAEVEGEIMDIEEITIPRLADMHLLGSMSLKLHDQKCAELDLQLQVLQERRAELKRALRSYQLTNEEIKALRTAAAQVHYRLDSLSRTQKKLLCRLFVDRIEMYRKKKPGYENKRGGWITSQRVFMRFNTNDIWNYGAGGEPENAVPQRDNSTKTSTRRLDGRRGGN